MGLQSKNTVSVTLKPTDQAEYVNKVTVSAVQRVFRH